jgi:hypothetical protein
MEPKEKKRKEKGNKEISKNVHFGSLFRDRDLPIRYFVWDCASVSQITQQQGLSFGKYRNQENYTGMVTIFHLYQMISQEFQPSLRNRRTTSEQEFLPVSPHTLTRASVMFQCLVLANTNSLGRSRIIAYASLDWWIDGE